MVDACKLRRGVVLMLEKHYPDKVIRIMLEKAVYNYAVRQAKLLNIVRSWDNNSFIDLYKNRLRSLVRNHRSPNLLSLLSANPIDWDKISRLSCHDLNPERWEKLINDKAEREKNMYAPKQGNTDMFICSKCKRQGKKANNCSYYQLQTRSADEPMTTYVSCLECGQRWKC